MSDATASSVKRKYLVRLVDVIFFTLSSCEVDLNIPSSCRLVALRGPLPDRIGPAERRLRSDPSAAPPQRPGHRAAHGGGQ